MSLARSGRAPLLGAALSLLLFACTTPASPGGAPASSARAIASAPVAAPSAPASGSASAPIPAASPSASAAPAEDAGVALEASADASVDAASAAEAPIDPKNKVAPVSDGPELEARARGLFDAIVRDEPALGDPFWFPEEPFIPLKDVKGPDKYWKELHRLFVNDVHALHKKRKSWEGATFESYEMGSTPTWVKPGDEANKIGYYRSYHGKLRYRVDGQRFTIDVHTLITWQGRWFITHLSKRKK